MDVGCRQLVPDVRGVSTERPPSMSSIRRRRRRRRQAAQTSSQSVPALHQTQLVRRSVGRSVTCLSSHATHHVRNTPFSHGEPEPVLSLQLAAEPCRMQLAARLGDNIFELDGAQRAKNSANASKLNQSDLGFEIEQYCYVRITPDSDADICRIASKTLWRQSFRRVS